MQNNQSRISSAREVAEQLRPLMRSPRLEDYFLYWIPTRSTQIPAEQRIWLNAFLDRLSDYLVKKKELRPEVFLQYKTVFPDLMDRFLDLSLELIPILGFGRKPGVPLPPVPSEEEIKKLGEGKPFVFGDYVGDFSYWFLAKEERKERESFIGFGGMTLLFMPPNPIAPPSKIPIPPRLKEHPGFRDLFAKFDPDKVIAQGEALCDPWLKRSLELYGDSIPKSPQTKHVPFIVPILRSRDFQNSPDERKKLAEICAFYITESPVDRGVLLASHCDHQEAIIAIIQAMRDEGMKYSEEA